MPSDKPSSKASEHRRTNKPIMEKKRRARINNCLNELKNLLLEAMRKDPARHSKLEKADILEMTVKYLQSLQRQQAALTAAADPGVVTKYRAGFNECAEEVQRFVAQHVDGMDGAVRQRLLGHLANCVNGFNTIPSTSGNGNSNTASSALSAAAAAAAAAATSGPSSDPTNVAALPHLLRSRLCAADADLAGLLATAVQQQQSNMAGNGTSGWQQMFPGFTRPRHHVSSSSATSTNSRPDFVRGGEPAQQRDIDGQLTSPLQHSPTSSSDGTVSSDSNSSTSGRQPRYRRRYQAYQQPRKQHPEHVFAVPRQTGFAYAPSAINTTGFPYAATNTTSTINNNNNNNNVNNDNDTQLSGSNALYLAPEVLLLAEYMGNGRRDSSLSDVGSMMSSSGGGSSSEDATGSISSCSGSSRYSSATSAIEMDFSDCEEEDLDDLEAGGGGDAGGDEVDAAGLMMPVDLSKDADKMWRPW